MSFNQGELLPNVDTEFKFTPVKWSNDLGTVPDNVRINEIIYRKFVQDDTALYTDIPLVGLYDKTRPLNVNIIFDTESGGAGDVEWIVDYMVTEHGTAASGTFTTNPSSTNRTRAAGTKLEVLTLSGIIPEQSALSADSATLTLRFGRRGLDAADTLNDSILFLGINVFQGDA